MSEQSSRQSGQNEWNEQSRQGEQRRQSGEGQRGNNPLRTDRGDTTIQESVVSQVAGIAGGEIEGIRMGGGAQQRASGLLGSVTGGSGGGRTQGVTVEVGREEAAVDLTLTLEYGRSAPQVADAVRRNVISRIESLLGLSVTEVNVSVTGIFFPEEEQSQQEDQGGQSQRSASRVS